MTKRAALALVALVVLAGSHPAHAQSAATAPSKTRGDVTMLASDRLDGRQAGSEGARLAADYLVAELKKLGARPLPGQADFRLPFSFTAGVKDGGTTLMLGPQQAGSHEQTPQGFSSSDKVQALSFSDNAEVTGEVVFAGYGLVVPDSQNFGYDSYATLDVKDKVVVVFRYFPEDADQKTRQILSRYADLRYKAMQARQRGARALLVVTGPRSPNAGETIPMSFDTALAGSGIVAASVSADVAQVLFAGVKDTTLDAIQQSFDSGNPHTAGFPLPGVTVTVRTAVVREKQDGFNVVGYLPATARIALPKPWVALGAHYDHLGHGSHGNSLAAKEDAGKIHHGADDNASGTAAVLAAGRALARQQRSRHVLLAFWSAEEIGLIGSNAFVSHPPVPIDQLAAYFNFDMVGRMQDNKLTVQAVGTSPAWKPLIERANAAAGFELVLQDDPYQPTDVASFNQVSVPSLAFFTGTHVDYHKPSDTADKINYHDLDRIVDFAVTLASRVGQQPEALAFAKVEQTGQQTGGGRAGVRIFTGTIPDYATDVKGLLLSGVIGGGPAESAGLQKGDVIVQIGDQTIANIYDYTYALEALKVNQPVKLFYLRGGERKETTLTPAARK